MSDFKTTRKFLDENNVTADDMDAMWVFMRDKNPIIENLTGHGKDWTDLNQSAMKSLIDLYNKAKE